MECNIKIYKDVSIYLNECNVNGRKVEYTYGKEQIKFISAVTEENKTLAGKVPQGNFELGDEYVVNVDGKHQYNFYILSNEDDKISLIMSRNVCSDGTLATSTNKCLMAWNSENDNSYGPVTAMDYLHETTKNWSNIDNIRMDYTDEGENYGGIATVENITTITKKDGTTTATYDNLKARLPKKSETLNTGCKEWVSNSEPNAGTCPIYIVNGLHNSVYYSREEMENIALIYGYWTLLSYSKPSAPNRAIYISVNGLIDYSSLNIISYGIRPVIEVSKSDLS